MSTQVPTYSLAAILKRVKQIVNQHTFQKFFWVKVQISKIKSDKNGNYYLNLIQTQDGTVIAKCEAYIWASHYLKIAHKLKDDTTQILKEGVEVLCYCAIDFSEVYGLRLQITDVDLSFSLGEIEKRKLQTLEFLKKNQLLNKNKTQKLPLVIQKIALIASITSAGFEDFIKQLQHNEFNFVYQISVFPCNVQGENAVLDITNAMSQVDITQFDCAVLIRGGGSKFDLEVFNDIKLAQSIANFQLPVLTGIGHETDLNIADLVAYQHFKTPTAVAAFILSKTQHFYIFINQKYQSIIDNYTSKIVQNKHKIQQLGSSIKANAMQLSQKESQKLHQTSNHILLVSQQKIHQQKIHLKTNTQKLSFYIQNPIQNQAAYLQKSTALLHAQVQRNLVLSDKKMTTNLHLIQHFVLAKINAEKQRIEQYAHIPEAYNPQNVLDLGYAIIRKDKKLVTPNTPLQIDDELEIELADKIYKVQIKNLSEIPKWKNIITKKQHQN